ncbi:hypothetical protein J6590_105114, partial [Homalodisca vitripennis]
IRIALMTKASTPSLLVYSTERSTKPLRCKASAAVKVFISIFAFVKRRRSARGIAVGPKY